MTGIINVMREHYRELVERDRLNAARKLVEHIRYAVMLESTDGEIALFKAKSNADEFCKEHELHAPALRSVIDALVECKAARRDGEGVVIDCDRLKVLFKI